MQAEARKKPIVLFFNDFFNRPPDIEALSCAIAASSQLTGEGCARRLRLSFTFLRCTEIRRVKKYPGQLWVAWSMESRVNYPLLADHSFMDKFDIRMTYEQSADIWCSYLPRKRDFEQALATPIADKTASACAVMLQSVCVRR